LFPPFFSWSFLSSFQTVSLVPFRHDEYPRFISGAYPFYASTLSTVAAFGLFCVLWLAIGSAESEKKKGKVRMEKVKA
jgi:oligosaccharyltransferase complex subunit beta